MIKRSVLTISNVNLSSPEDEFLELNKITTLNGICFKLFDLTILQKEEREKLFIEIELEYHKKI